MKKLFVLFASAALVFAACTEKTPQGEPGQDPATDLPELHLDIPVKLELGADTEGWAYKTIELPGDQILEFFGLEDSQAFYDAMGYLVWDADPELRSQQDNTLMFGYCVQDSDGEWEYYFKPSSSGNIGHWFSAEGEMTSWAVAEDGTRHYFYVESNCWNWNSDYRVEDPAAEDSEWSYDLVWSFNLGVHPDNTDFVEGDKFSAVEFIFEEETQKTCYIHWNIEIVGFVDPEAGQYNGTPSDKETTLDVTIGTPVDLAVLQDAFQLTKYEFNQCVAAGQIATKNYIDNAEVAWSAGGFGGVWFDVDGKQTWWGPATEDNPETEENEASTASVYYLELYSSAKELAAYSGYYDETGAAAMAGKSYNNFKQEVIYTPAEGQSYTCTINYNITF